MNRGMSTDYYFLAPSSLAVLEYFKLMSKVGDFLRTVRVG